jgi:hypothetical protein
VAQAYNLSTWEDEVGAWRVQGQPGLHSKTLSQNKQIKTISQTKNYLTLTESNYVGIAM